MTNTERFRGVIETGILSLDCVACAGGAWISLDDAMVSHDFGGKEAIARVVVEATRD